MDPRSPGSGTALRDNYKEDPRDGQGGSWRDSPGGGTVPFFSARPFLDECAASRAVCGGTCAWRGRSVPAIEADVLLEVV